MFLHKCLTREAAIERYGNIDFASGHWPNDHLWLSSLKIDPAKFPNWHVLNTQHPVETITCNVDIHDPLSRVLESVFDRGFAHLLQTFDGCFNIRMVRGTTSVPSAHSYGLAIDLNAATNALGSHASGFYDHPSFVQCFTEQGLDWGGAFNSRKDPMHFSYCWE